MSAFYFQYVSILFISSYFLPADRYICNILKVVGFYLRTVSWYGQVVILIGSAASADDISRDIAQVAKEVHIASRSVQNSMSRKQPAHDNMWLHPMVKVCFLLQGLIPRCYIIVKSK